MKSYPEIIISPVLELQPLDFSKIEREFPQKLVVDAPKEWMTLLQEKLPIKNSKDLKN